MQLCPIGAPGGSPHVHHQTYRKHSFIQIMPWNDARLCVCLRWCLDGISRTFFTPLIDQPVKTLSRLSQPAHICEERSTQTCTWVTPSFSASVLLHVFPSKRVFNQDCLSLPPAVWPTCTRAGENTTESTWLPNGTSWYPQGYQILIITSQNLITSQVRLIGVFVADQKSFLDRQKSFLYEAASFSHLRATSDSAELLLFLLYQQHPRNDSIDCST